MITENLDLFAQYEVRPFNVQRFLFVGNKSKLMVICCHFEPLNFLNAGFFINFILNKTNVTSHFWYIQVWLVWSFYLYLIFAVLLLCIT